MRTSRPDIYLILLSVLWLAAPAGAASRTAGELNRQGRHDEAETAAHRALRQNPDDGRALLELAVVNTSRAIEADPDAADAYAVRAMANDLLGNRDRVLPDLRSAASRNPDYRPALNSMERALGAAPARNAPDTAAQTPAAPPANQFVLLGVLLVAVALAGGLIALILKLFKR
ncbi:MAG: tetratricopeptide repeat protein [Elusimicrobiota bacterium]